MTLNSLIDGDSVMWDCDDCEAETAHDVVDETVTPDGGGQYIIDTRIRCKECGTEQEVTEGCPTDPHE